MIKDTYSLYTVNPTLSIKTKLLSIHVVNKYIHLALQRVPKVMVIKNGKLYGTYTRGKYNA